MQLLSSDFRFSNTDLCVSNTDFWFSNINQVSRLPISIPKSKNGYVKTIDIKIIYSTLLHVQLDHTTTLYNCIQNMTGEPYSAFQLR